MQFSINFYCDFVEALALNTIIDHALTRKIKEVYIERGAKFIVDAIMEDKWILILDNVKELILQGMTSYIFLI